jgi:3-deoxy-D-manno-octulosonic-acid transferase
MMQGEATTSTGEMSLSAPLYRAITTLALPLVQLFIQHRVMRGKEEPTRVDERRGIASIRRPDGPLIWMHAASIGEAQSVLVLIDRILRANPDLHILMTTGTVTSARLMGTRLPGRAIHQYVPIDRVTWVRRFLDYWKPDAGFWIESELWPNLLMESRRRGVAMALLNARMSESSLASWKRAPSLARELRGCFEVILAQDETIAGRLRELGARRVSVSGNLKLAADPLPATAADLIDLQESIGDRPVWLAASTHRGEEDIAGAVHSNLSDRVPGLLTIVAPRHPQRADDIEASLQRTGLRVARRSRGDAIDADTDIYLVDATGVLGLLYRIARIAFVGGSLIPHGGQNMLEAAQLGCAVLHGPHVDNFRSIAGELATAGAAVEIADGAELTRTVGELLGDPDRANAMAEAAESAAARKQDVLDTVLSEITPLIAGATARPR